MNWTGTNKQKETITDDGYRLIVKCVDKCTYTWSVFYRGNRIKKFTDKSPFKETMARAKRQAIRLMVNHMLKKI